MNKLKKQFQILKQGYYDIKNFYKFKKDMIKEADFSKSDFNKYHLNLNKYKTVIYTQLDIPENFEEAGSDEMKYQYLLDLIKPINNYLQNKLFWGEYLVYNFLHFENEEDPNQKIRSYIVTWAFTPISINTFKFYRNLFLTLGFLLAIIFSGIKFIPILL